MRPQLGRFEFAARRSPPRRGAARDTACRRFNEAQLGLHRAHPTIVYSTSCPGCPLAALNQVIAHGLGTAPSRPTLARIVDAQGQPVVPLQVRARWHATRTIIDLVTPSPCPRTSRSSCSPRLPALPPAAHTAVLVAAAPLPPHGRDGRRGARAGTRRRVGARRGRRGRRGARPGARADSATHPLLASVVYGSCLNSQRRRLRERLAGVVADSEASRHLAASVTEADEWTASGSNKRRTERPCSDAHDAAAELFEASCQLTPPDHAEELVERTLGRASAVIRDRRSRERSRARAAGAVAGFPDTRAARTRVASPLFCRLASRRRRAVLETAGGVAGRSRGRPQSATRCQREPLLVPGPARPEAGTRTGRASRVALERRGVEQDRFRRSSDVFGQRRWSDRDRAMTSLERGLELEAKASPLSAAR